jgi:hypothetical protein
LLDETVPQLTVLIDGLSTLGANCGGSAHGVFTDQAGVLSNDFVNLLDQSTEWKASKSAKNVYDGVDRATGRSDGPPLPTTVRRLVLRAPRGGRGVRLEQGGSEVRERLRRRLGLRQ